MAFQPEAAQVTIFAAFDRPGMLNMSHYVEAMSFGKMLSPCAALPPLDPPPARGPS